MKKKKSVRKKSKLVEPRFNPVDEIQYFMNHMNENGFSIHVCSIEQGTGRGLQIGNMKVHEVLGSLAVAEAQIKNGIIHNHSFDATVQAMENNPKLVKRYIACIEDAHNHQRCGAI